MPPVRLSRFDSPREKISARHPRHFVPSWRISCSFREIVEGTTLLHVVVTNPHPRRRSTATVFYYVLYRISRTRCSLHEKPMSAGETAHFCYTRPIKRPNLYNPTRIIFLEFVRLFVPVNYHYNFQHLRNYNFTSSTSFIYS